MGSDDDISKVLGGGVKPIKAEEHKEPEVVFEVPGTYTVLQQVTMVVHSLNAGVAVIAVDSTGRSVDVADSAVLHFDYVHVDPFIASLDEPVLEPAF